MTEEFTEEDYEYLKDKIERIDMQFETVTLAKISHSKEVYGDGYLYRSSIKKVVNADKPTYFFFNGTESPSKLKYGERGKDGIKDKIPAQKISTYVETEGGYEITEATDEWKENHEHSFRIMLDHLIRRE